MTGDHPAPRRPHARGGPLQGGRRLLATALLFDNDGVLVDSDAAVAASWSRWAAEHGLVPDDVVAVVHGRRAADTVAALLPAERRAAASALIDRYELEDAATVPAVAGAAGLLATLPAHAWAVVTSGTPALATARLTAAGLPLPGVLVTARDVRTGKPDPEGYLLGARLLGVPPEETVVVEDSPAGIAAGRAAGARVLGVGARALGSGADVVVGDLTQVSWADGVLTVAAGAVLRDGTP